MINSTSSSLQRLVGGVVDLFGNLSCTVKVTKEGGSSPVCSWPAVSWEHEFRALSLSQAEGSCPSTLVLTQEHFKRFQSNMVPSEKPAQSVHLGIQFFKITLLLRGKQELLPCLSFMQTFISDCKKTQ